jgi:insertion element IS1 protein InsB
VESYTNKAYDPNVRPRIFFFIVNGCGIRAAARLLGIAKDTVASALRNMEAQLWYVNYDCLESHKNEKTRIDLVPVKEAEMDEKWSFAGDKSQRCWLWRATGHNTGDPLAFHFGAREHKNPEELLRLLKPFDINMVYSDNNFACKSLVTESEVVTGKENTEKIERKDLSLRTWSSRLVRKGIRFSKDPQTHKIAVALVINFWFFHRIIG